MQVIYSEVNQEKSPLLILARHQLTGIAKEHSSIIDPFTFGLESISLKVIIVFGAPSEERISTSLPHDI